MSDLNTMTSATRGFSWTDILNSKHGGFIGFGLVMLAAYAIHEYFGAVDKGMEYGYDMNLSANQYGNVGFAQRTAPVKLIEAGRTAEPVKQEEHDTEEEGLRKKQITSK